jgi:UDP-N-acetylglucosamine 2-epimerase (non-hydrolysing)
MEGIDVGLAELVGSDPTRIANAIERALTLPAASAPAINPYGDGHAAERIAELILSRFHPTSAAPG